MKSFHLRLAMCLSVLLSLVVPHATEAQTVALTPGIISTIAGTGAGGFSGDGSAANAAELFYPSGVAFDSAGNLYIADYANNRIRVVNRTGATATIAGVANIPAGAIATVAGSSTACSTPTAACGDGGLAISAELNGPTGVALDSSNNLYIADQSDNRVRMVNAATGNISTVAGNGTGGFSGDGSTATSAELFYPVGVALDNANNLYIADQLNNRVRKVTGGIITTVAGGGSGSCVGSTDSVGDGCAATSAELSSPAGVALDNANNLYIADQDNNRIRVVNTQTSNVTIAGVPNIAAGAIATVAGNGTEGFYGDAGPAISAELAFPAGVTLDRAGDIYIPDLNNYRVRKVDTQGIITTVAGSSTPCSNPVTACGDGGVATGAELSDSAAGVALDSAGDIYIADESDNRIREVNVSTSALTFGSLTVYQTSSAQNVAVSNVGSAPITTFAFGGVSNFVQSNDCVAPLAAGATCTLGVTFAPTVAGNPLAAMLTVGDNAPNSPQTVNLTGIGVALTPAFNGLTASPTIPFGTPSIYLSGTIGVGGHYPSSGETVYVSINGNQESATIGASGGFSVMYTGLAALSAGPYTITYSYPGDSTFNSAIDTSTTLTVSQSGGGTTYSTLTLTVAGTGSGDVKDGPPFLIKCFDANGVVSGSCSGSYANGSSVTLTETTTAGTFGGWGGACTSFGTGATCNLSITGSNLVASADFVPAPVTVPLNQFCTGTNQTATVHYCPANTFNGAGVCTDPNGVDFTVLIPVVNPAPGGGNQCFQLQATATEVTGTGICPASQVGYNGQGFPNGPTTDFDCRFVDYYNYGTTDEAGDVQTPLCYPYSNGNCVFYDLQLNGNGGPVSADQISGGVYWQININPSDAPLPAIDKFVVPSGYNSLPRMLDDPDEDEIPPLPWGTSCSQAMNMEVDGAAGTSTPTNPPIYCQFNNDITTFFSGTVGGDPPTAGGKSKVTNNVVLAFLPTSSTGTATPPTVTAPTITVDCLNGCTPLSSVSSGGTLTFTEDAGGTAAVTETGYPTPTVTIAIANNTASVNAAESGNTVTLTAPGNFSSQYVVPNMVVVDGCTSAAYNGTFPLASVNGNQLTYVNTATGLPAESDGYCMVTALPAGLSFNATTGVLGGTPGPGSAGSYSTTLTASNITTPPITGEGSTNLNFTLTVGGAPLTITAGSATVAYGTGLPTITPIITGLQNGDTASALGNGLTCSATGVPAGNPVGTYTTSCSGAVDSNYAIAYQTGTLQITAVPLTIAASSGSFTYGGTVPAITASYSGFVNGDTAASLTTAPNCSTTATSGSPVSGSPYPSSCSGAVDNNYTINYVNGSVTESAASLTITAGSATVPYGSGLPSITPIITGLQNGDPASVLGNGLTCSATGVPAGNPVGTYATSCSGAVDSNYAISYGTGTLQITAVPLTITASSGSFTYGGTVPTITASYSGFVNGQSGSSLTTQPTCSTTATSSSAPGSYPSSCSGAVDGNYTINYVNGNVTESAAALTITASSGSFTYGGTVPTITASYSGFVLGQSASNLTTQPTCSTTATSSSSPGSYASSCSGAADSNYTIKYVSGSVTESAAPLTITASSATMIQGSTPPTITASYSGFVLGQSAANLTTQPTCSTTATSSSSPGSYPSSCSGAVDPNYSISYVNGTVTVTGTWTIKTALPCTGAGAFSTTAAPVSVGQSVTCVFTVTNNTATTSSVTVTIPGGGPGGIDNEGPNDADDYSIVRNSCKTVAAGGGSCQVTVTWTPDSDDLPLYPTGSYAYLQVLNGSGKSAPVLVSTTMTGVTKDPTVSVYASTTALTSPYSYTFPSSTSKETETFTLTNNGPTPLFLTRAIAISYSSYFNLSAGTCTNGTQIASGSSCTFSVTFTPPSSGTTVEKATVTINDNAVTTANPTTISPQTISLSGAR